MKNRKNLEDIREEVVNSKQTINWENLSMFISFMNQRFCRRIIEYCETMDEFRIKISYDKKGTPTVELCDAIVLKGKDMMPFDEYFVTTMAEFIQFQMSKGESEELGITAYMPGDRNSDDELSGPYEFWLKS